MNVFSSCPSSSPARGRSRPSPMFVLTSVWPSSTWGRPLPLLRLSSPRPPSGRPLRPRLRLHAIIRPLLAIMLLLDSNPVATAAGAARLWRLPQQCTGRDCTSHTTVALAAQPLDRLYPHVARVHRRRRPWPSTTRSPACTSAIGSGGRRATGILLSTTSFRVLLPAAPSGTSYLGALDARGSR